MRNTFVIGIIVSSHGLKGMMKVKSLSGETEHFHNLKSVTLASAGRSLLMNVEEVKNFGSDMNTAKAFVLMKFEGISSPEEGRRYAGWEILVDRSDGAPLHGGEYYIDDLQGCALIMNGEVKGTVDAVYSSAPADLLEVRCGESGGGARRVLVPFIEKFIGRVDVEKRTIELKQEWILE